MLKEIEMWNEDLSKANKKFLDQLQDRVNTRCSTILKDRGVIFSDEVESIINDELGLTPTP